MVGYESDAGKYDYYGFLRWLVWTWRAEGPASVLYDTTDTTQILFGRFLASQSYINDVYLMLFAGLRGPFSFWPRCLRWNETSSFINTAKSILYPINAMSTRLITDHSNVSHFSLVYKIVTRLNMCHF